MDRNQAKEFYPIMQAFAEGKDIESHVNGKWYRVIEICNDINPQDYRIKPETKYRPFANTEECWTEMEKHKPFGWVRDKKEGYYVLITAVDNGDYMSLSGNSGWSFYSLMKDYTFTDGTPFGVKVEE